MTKKTVITQGCEKMFFQEVEVRKIQIDRCGKEEKEQKKNHQINSKKERKRSLKYLFFLFSPMNRKDLPGKASSCAPLDKLRKASLAVETALVLPLFFLGMVTMISFMDIYQIQTEHLSALCQKVKEAGMYAYVLDGTGVDEITLPDVYSYEPMGGLVSLPKVWMFNSVKVHAWTGIEYQTFADGTEPEAMVYITDSGTVCHKNLGCSYLNLSVIQSSGSSVPALRNDYGEKYSACEICSRGQKPGGSVYITKKGNRYHNLESCSGLKRSVRMVKESQADMPVCSRCG